MAIQIIMRRILHRRVWRPPQYIIDLFAEHSNIFWVVAMIRLVFGVAGVNPTRPEFSPKIRFQFSTLLHLVQVGVECGAQLDQVFPSPRFRLVEGYFIVKLQLGAIDISEEVPDSTKLNKSHFNERASYPKHKTPGGETYGALPVGARWDSSDR